MKHRFSDCTEAGCVECAVFAPMFPAPHREKRVTEMTREELEREVLELRAARDKAPK